MSVRLAIDAMGGDHGLTVTVPAALSFLQSHPDAELLLVGRRRGLLKYLAANNVDRYRDLISRLGLRR